MGALRSAGGVAASRPPGAAGHRCQRGDSRHSAWRLLSAWAGAGRAGRRPQPGTQPPRPCCSETADSSPRTGGQADTRGRVCAADGAAAAGRPAERPLPVLRAVTQRPGALQSSSSVGAVRGATALPCVSPLLQLNGSRGPHPPPCQRPVLPGGGDRARQAAPEREGGAGTTSLLLVPKLQEVTVVPRPGQPGPRGLPMISGSRSVPGAAAPTAGDPEGTGHSLTQGRTRSRSTIVFATGSEDELEGNEIFSRRRG